MKAKNIHLFWYEPFIHWVMGMEVPLENKSGLFGGLTSRRDLESAWLHTLTRLQATQLGLQQDGTSWP
jgi:hypothetical protein